MLIVVGVALVDIDQISAATPIYVRIGGDNGACDGTVDVDYSAAVAPACAVASIQRGINLADSGGVVHIGAGTFTAADGALAVIDKPLTLTGDSQSMTILDGGAYGMGTDSSGLGNG